ncbi:MAG: hypothetical protein KBB70_01935 [Candidatus Pacebacteria bacterium]|nr:hypothetical protein [Candidatus Paceibacterota bacterium]
MTPKEEKEIVWNHLGEIEKEYDDIKGKTQDDHLTILKKASYRCYNRLAQGVQQNFPVQRFIKYARTLLEKLQEAKRDAAREKKKDDPGYTDTDVSRQVRDLLNEEGYWVINT